MDTATIEIPELMEDVFDPLPISAIISDVEKKELSSEKSPYTLLLRREDFSDEKELIKFIKSIESQIRFSPEYRIWTSYIRECLGFYMCSITGEVHAQTRVDLHHHPVSLFAIVKTVIFKYINSSKEFCSFDIAEDVIELHYENRIGYLPLVRSLHEKYHSGFLSIPIELVHGDYHYLIREFDFDEDDEQSIQSKLAINKSNCSWNKSWSKDRYPVGENNLQKLNIEEN